MLRIFRPALDSVQSFARDDGYAMASHIALSGLIAIFPFLIFVTSLSGFFGAQVLADKAASTFFEVWPPQVADPILTQIHEVLNNRHGGLLTISAILALYFSASGVEALRTGLNRAYGARETRSWWILRLESIGYVFVGALALLSLAFLLVLGPIVWAFVVKAAPPLKALTHIVAIGRYFGATVALVLALIIAHRDLPNIKISLRRLAPGIVLTLVAWMAFGWLFSYYIAHFALNYIATYAGLASIMIAIVFLYVTAAIFIFGGEFNAALLRARVAREQAEYLADD